MAVLAGVGFLVAGCATTRTVDPGRTDYLAGLAAYHRGDNEEARRRLTAAVTELYG